MLSISMIVGNRNELNKVLEKIELGEQTFVIDCEHGHDVRIRGPCEFIEDLVEVNFAYR